MTRAPHISVWRVVSGLGLVALAVTALAGAILVVQKWHAQSTARLLDTEVANTRLSAALAQGRQLREASAAGGSATFSPDYLESAQDSIAAADLQSRLRAMALDKRVELTALNTLTPRQSGDVTFVGVRLSFRAPLPVIQALLHTTETTQPLLFVERLALRADAALGRGGSEGAEGGPPLAVEVDVYAPKRPKALASAMAPAVRIEPATGVRP